MAGESVSPVGVRIGNPKDFWTGIIYIAFGAAALYFGAEYRMGIASRMGPGYFPKVLASLLVLIGLISLVRSFTSTGESIGRLSIKGMILIPLSTVAFAYLLPRGGLIVALVALMLMSAVASIHFRLTARSILMMAALVLFCLIIFVAGLGVPMPTFGSWLSPYTDPYTVPFKREVLDPAIPEYVRVRWSALIEAVARLFGR